LVDKERKFMPSSESEDEAPDFDYLLKLPPSAGSHFLLKSEQEKFGQEIDSSQFSNHFKIDTNILNLAIKSIPFNERHEIKGIEWNSTELLRFQEEAATNENKYKDMLEKNIFAAATQKPGKSKTEKIEIKVKALRITEPKTVPQEPVKDDKESLEKFLDDLL
jgi:hypothetical protein